MTDPAVLQSTEADVTPGNTAQAAADGLVRRYNGAGAEEILRGVIGDDFRGRVALTSSFGAEAAVLLHMVAQIDPATPILFLNTGKLFGETLRYKDELVERLRLTDVRVLTPSPERVDGLDPDGVLWYGNPDMCCYIRKVEPYEDALNGFAATITGRKGFHGGGREGLPVFEGDEDGRVKVNPLARWGKDEIDAYFAAHELPRHPLEADGFLSIGCMPCTDRVAPGEDVRAGRWRGRGKTECGIHVAARWRMIGGDSP